jgi:Acetyltransferases
MTYKIRKATIEDLSDIQRLNHELFKKEFNEYDNSLNINWPLEQDGKNYFTNQIENQFVYIVLYDSKTIGYLSGLIRKTNSCFKTKRAVIDNMIIEEKYRNEGIGTLLIDEFKKWCKENSVDEILVDVFMKNNKGINFYKNNDFDDYEAFLKCKL